MFREITGVKSDSHAKFNASGKTHVQPQTLHIPDLDSLRDILQLNGSGLVYFFEEICGLKFDVEGALDSFLTSALILESPLLNPRCTTQTVHPGLKSPDRSCLATEMQKGPSRPFEILESDAMSVNAEINPTNVSVL